jgi:hypothetical protein
MWSRFAVKAYNFTFILILGGFPLVHLLLDVLCRLFVAYGNPGWLLGTSMVRKWFYFSTNIRSRSAVKAANSDSRGVQHTCADKQMRQTKRKVSEAHIQFRKDLASGFYHHGYTAHGQQPVALFQDVCLIDTLRVLGVKVPYTGNGQFWALADGNRMLEPFSRELDTIQRPLFGIYGKYVLYWNDHFFALKTYDDYFTLSSSKEAIIEFGARADFDTLLSIPDISIWRLASTIESSALRNYESFYGLVPGQGRLEDIVESCAGVEGWACATLPSLSFTHGQSDKCAGGKKCRRHQGRIRQVVRRGGGVAEEAGVAAETQSGQSSHSRAAPLLSVVPVAGGSVSLRDSTPKPVALEDGSQEESIRRQSMLNGVTQKHYYSLTTSGSDCACALHASFGTSHQAGALFLPHARRMGARVVETLIGSNRPHDRQVRADLADLIQKELAQPYMDGKGDAFGNMFWNAADANLRDQLTQHAWFMKCEQQVRDQIKREIRERSREVCSSNARNFLELLSVHLGALDNFWMHFYEEPFEWRSGVKIIRGTKKPWPANATYESKMQALEDPREDFDSLREAFFLPTRTLARTVVESIYAVTDHMADGDLYRSLGDLILSRYLELEEVDVTWPELLQDAAFGAYLETIRTCPYYFSVGELVWICKAVRANIIVVQRFPECYVVEQYYLDGIGEIALVAIDSSEDGRVAAHFERLCSTDVWYPERLAEPAPAPVASSAKLMVLGASTLHTCDTAGPSKPETPSSPCIEPFRQPSLASSHSVEGLAMGAATSDTGVDFSKPAKASGAPNGDDGAGNAVGSDFFDTLMAGKYFRKPETPSSSCTDPFRQPSFASSHPVEGLAPGEATSENGNVPSTAAEAPGACLASSHSLDSLPIATATLNVNQASCSSILNDLLEDFFFAAANPEAAKAVSDAPVPATDGQNLLVITRVMMGV